MELRKKLAGELGFEPRQTESESVVLPLHHSPRIAQRLQHVRASMANFSRPDSVNPGLPGALLLASRRPWQARGNGLVAGARQIRGQLRAGSLRRQDRA